MTRKGDQTILIVEDEALIAMDLQALLETAGYHVLGPANSPKAALKLLDGAVPDLALLDVNLGGADVFAVADALTARKANMIFLTGHSSQQLPEGHRHRPLLAKPYLPHILLQAVQRALSQPATAA